MNFGFRRVASEIHCDPFGPKTFLSFFVFTVAFGLFSVTDSARAGRRFGGQQAVGGVVVDAAGVVRAATLEDRQQMANALQNANRALPGDLQQEAEMRMISLKGLQAAVAESKQSGKDIPSEVRFLAGLQRIAYVFVDQENQDVILAGPAEPWEMREDGFVVGKISGQATMRLEDLTVALRSVENARQNGITCSIEPTDEGRLRLQQLLRRIVASWAKPCCLRSCNARSIRSSNDLSQWCSQ